MESQLWAVREFAGAELADPRQVRSVVAIASSLDQHSERSFSSACGHAGRQAAHRIFKHEKTSVAGLLAGHVKETAKRCAEHPRVLVAQDTTFFTYAQDQILGLCCLNHRPKPLGLVSHSALAMTPEGTPLGLMHLDIWGATPEEELPAPGETVPEEERESQKWLRALASVGTALPPATAGIVIADREADIFRLFAQERPANIQLLVRASQNRNVEHLGTPGRAEGAAEPARLRGKLFTVASAGEVVGNLVVSVPRRSKREGLAAVPERKACLTLRVREVWLQPPSKRRPEQRVWIIDALEEDPPEEVAGIHWVLLSTLPVRSLDEARTMVGYYARRWLIERLHYTLKTGLRVERLQIDDATSISHALALFYVAAWRVMFLTLAARQEPDASASQVLEADEIEALSAAVGQKIKTLRQAVNAIAKLGGLLPYRKGPPGLKTLWQGWRFLQAMVVGYRVGKTGKPAITL